MFFSCFLESQQRSSLQQVLNQIRFEEHNEDNDENNYWWDEQVERYGLIDPWDVSDEDQTAFFEGLYWFDEV